MRKPGRAEVGNIRRIVFLLIGVSVVASLFILPGCGEEEPQPREIPLWNVSDNYVLKCRVITNDDEYTEFINASVVQEEARIIDFDEYIVLTASGGLSMGRIIFINRVVQTGTRVDVQVEVIYIGEPGVVFIPESISPESYYVLVERDAFQPRGELQFVFHDMKGNEFAELRASV